MARVIDRRESERVKCKKAILHNTNPSDFFYRGEVLNYSKKGLYFESNMDLLPGDDIFILVKKRSNEVTYSLKVKIIWCKELQETSFDLGYGAKLREKRKLEVI